MSPDQFQSDAVAWIKAVACVLTAAGAAGLPIVLWVRSEFQKLRNASLVNSGRIDQHDKLQGVATTATGIVNTVSTIGDDVHAQYTPEQVAASDALSAARSRVGQVVDPHDLGNAVIAAQSGVKP